MLTDKLTGENLLALQKERGKICVSIVVPTHRLSPERRADKLELERAIAEARMMLQIKYTESQIEPLLKAMDELYQSVDFTHNDDGLGFYVSPDVKLAVWYPVLVEKKVMVGDNFEVRDLLYKMNYAKPYFALLLTEKRVRLFEGSWNELTEIKDKNFPKPYEEEYSYNPPSQSTSYAGYAHVKGFEKDKSEMEETRFKSFFRHADELLGHYLLNDTPLILLGPGKELAWFNDISAHNKNVISKIAGSYDHSRIKDLADIAWPAMQLYLKTTVEQAVNDFREKIGAHLAVSGIQEVWQAVKEGRGLKLLVEKDYRSPGYVDKDALHLFLRKPQKPHKILADAVDDIIETTLEKNGDVLFTDNDFLKEYQRIALITRF